MYTVKDMAEKLHITEHAIRYYTDQQLVPNLKRDSNNTRIFDHESLKWLVCVKHLRECGMTIKDIKTYIDLCLEGNTTIKKRYEVFKKQQEIAITQLEEAKERAAYITNKTAYYRQVIQQAR